MVRSSPLRLLAQTRRRVLLTTPQQQQQQPMMLMGGRRRLGQAGYVAPAPAVAAPRAAIGPTSQSIRWLSSSGGSGGSSSKGSNKKKAMQRQQSRHPVTADPACYDKPLPLFTGASPKSFAATLSSDPIVSLGGATSGLGSGGGAVSSPLQISPFDPTMSLLTPNGETRFCETDKPSLSSLPDDAAALLDKESLFDPTIHLPYAPQDWTGYETSTPLTEFLMQRIGVSGQPISTAEYMRHALTHPQFGYYTNPPSSKASSMSQSGHGVNDDDDDDDDDLWEDEPTATATTTSSDGYASPNESTLIGPKGDFVTAPEVSHVFGHCLCVWFMTQWKSPLLGQPADIQLVELGPGRGTLLTDILQLATTSKLQDFGQAIRVVHLVEASYELRAQQEAALQEGLGASIDFEFVQVSSLAMWEKKSQNETGMVEGDKQKETEKDEDDSTSTEKKEDTSQKKFAVRVEWHDDFRSFQRTRNKDWPVFMVLQEFLDALPVHVFQKTDEGWRERMVDVASVMEDDDENENDKDKATTPVTSKPSSASDKPTKEDALIPRLRQVLAPDMTPAVELFLEPNRNYDHAPVGSVVEICPEALVLVQDMAQVLEENQGVALMIDYGQDGTSDTLRAFSKHQQVPLTSAPGQVDVTADVDFYALRHSIDARSAAPASTKRDSGDNTDNTDNTEEDGMVVGIPEDRRMYAFGPITQGEFLMRMGAGDMVINSIESEDTTAEEAQRLTDALKFLVMPEHMGERFKVLAMAPKREGIFAPAGMER